MATARRAPARIASGWSLEVHIAYSLGGRITREEGPLCAFGSGCEGSGTRVGQNAQGKHGRWKCCRQSLTVSTGELQCFTPLGVRIAITIQP